MAKPFFGYNSREEAEQDFSKEYLESGEKTEKIIDIVDDPTVWPQTLSKQKKITRIETGYHIISY